MWTSNYRAEEAYGIRRYVLLGSFLPRTAGDGSLKPKHDDKRKADSLCPLFHELFLAPVTLVEYVQVEPFDPLLKLTQL